MFDISMHKDQNITVKLFVMLYKRNMRCPETVKRQNVNFTVP